MSGFDLRYYKVSEDHPRWTCRYLNKIHNKFLVLQIRAVRLPHSTKVLGLNPPSTVLACIGPFCVGFACSPTVQRHQSSEVRLTGNSKLSIDVNVYRYMC